MTLFSFQALQEPFPRWWGPFSPARGVRSGFRFYHGRFGTWVENEFGREFWTVQQTPDVRVLTDLVQRTWQGGRVLLLPNGLAIKPLNDDKEVGQRVVIGLFSGRILLERPEGAMFDLSEPGGLTPGAPWFGPRSTGIECSIQPDGSLRSTWHHPTSWGSEQICMQLHDPDPRLAGGFRLARPGASSGRVRITAHGHVITNRECNGGWSPYWVGRIDPASWPHKKEWIGA